MKRRTADQIRTEYYRLCAELGQLYYRQRLADSEIEAKVKRIKAVNLEHAGVEERHGKRPAS